MLLDPRLRQWDPTFLILSVKKQIHIDVKQVRVDMMDQIRSFPLRSLLQTITGLLFHFLLSFAVWRAFSDTMCSRWISFRALTSAASSSRSKKCPTSTTVSLTCGWCPWLNTLPSRCCLESNWRTTASMFLYSLTLNRSFFRKFLHFPDVICWIK